MLALTRVLTRFHGACGSFHAKNQILQAAAAAAPASQQHEMVVPKTMRALVKDKPAPGLTMKEMEVPAITPNDCLVRVKRTAICGTDLHIYNWDECVLCVYLLLWYFRCTNSDNMLVCL